MSKYDDIKKTLRPSSRKKLVGLMKAAQKKKKAGQTIKLSAKLDKKKGQS